MSLKGIGDNVRRRNKSQRDDLDSLDNIVTPGGTVETS